MSRKSREKDARRQEDLARQKEDVQNIGNQFLSQLVPGSQEYNELQSEILRLAQISASPADEQSLVREAGQRAVSTQQARIASGGAATPLEARTNLAVEGIRGAAAFRPEEQGVFQALRDETPTTDIAKLFQDLIGTARESDPVTDELLQNLLGKSREAPESLFEPELNLLQDRVNREANARGLASSGIPLEQLGRAGVELAIQEAQRREDIRRNRVMDVERVVQTGEETRRSRLSDVERLFQTGQDLRGREIGVEEAVTNLQAGRESNLTGLLERQGSAATENLLELLGARTTRSEQLRDVASALREAERQRLEGMFTDIEFNIGPIGVKKTPTKNAFQNAPTAPSAPTRSDVGSLLSAQRTAPSATGQPVDLSETLNLQGPRRRRQQSGFTTVQSV